MEAEKVSINERLQHVTWAWYSLTMSTAGFSSLLAAQPHFFGGLLVLGKILFIFDLIAFCVITLLLVNRFRRRPELFLRSFQNPSELLYVPTFLLSCAGIIICMQAYGVPSCGTWLVSTIRVFYWIYVALSFLAAVSTYTYLFAKKEMTPLDMAPNWIYPIYPVLLVGEIASFITKAQPPQYRMSIVVAGLTLQGLAFWATLPLYGVFIARLFKSGLPSANLRAGMFITVGPPAYTIVALIRMSTVLSSIPSTYFQLHPTAAENLQQSALAFGIFIWTLAFWFFAISLFSCLLTIKTMSFNLIFYSMIFPNIGFTLATISIGEGLASQGVTWVGSAMTILITIMYLSVLCAHAKAIWCGQILWPGKDEDKDT